LPGARSQASDMAISYIFRPLVDFALPPRCAGCGVIVRDDNQLCLTCWGSLDFLTGQGCASCGSPEVVDGLTCAPCLAHPPRHDGVRAAVAYGELARSIVLKLKHGGRTGLAGLIASAMARSLPDAPSLIVPVPLHRWRIWRRGFNQSALLAAHLVRGSNHVLLKEALVRLKRTPLLRGLGAKERAAAVRGAFAVAAPYRARIRGQTVLLVDDVYTSGATANACASALKRAGARRVTVICFARVLQDD
jgi:ComF family protein